MDDAVNTLTDSSLGVNRRRSLAAEDVLLDRSASQCGASVAFAFGSGRSVKHCK